jgi:tetratricopeptide (TPR) repeat protein
VTWGAPRGRIGESKMAMTRIEPFRLWCLSTAVLAMFAASACRAAPVAGPPASAVMRFGAFLAGRHAQEEREYADAAGWFAQALRADPGSPELLSRTFLMEAYEGRFETALPLAVKALRLDPTDGVANLVLLIDRVKAGDKAAALARAEALPADGLYRYAGPPALAWMRMAKGDLAGAVAALQGLDKFDGLAPLKYFQLGLIYDFAGQPAKAEENFKKTVEETGQINWRVTDALANFYERHGRADEAAAVYRRFINENSGSELAESVTGGKPGGRPRPLIGSAEEGLAEAFFDLASVVNRPETVDLALFYDRCALALRPQLALAQLLLSDILAGDDKPQDSLAVLRQIAPNSRYSWSARLRIAADLDTLGHTDEAISMLEEMAAKEPKRATADMQLGDVLREKKRYLEAADAYNEAIGRLKAAGMPERWSLYYSRGIAFERAGQWQKAEADLLLALKLKPDQPLVLNYLGYSWIDRGEHLHRGLQMIEKAVDLRPEDGYIVDSLGWAHYRLGDYRTAVEYLEKAVELVPDDPTINDHLGDAYWQTGRLIEARYQWRRALQFGPEKEDIKPIEAKLVRGVPPPTRANGG